jgi:type II secretory pathway pseudopilin PulG
MGAFVIFLSVLFAVLSAALMTNSSMYVRTIGRLSNVNVALANEQNAVERIRSEDITIMRQFQLNSTALRQGMNQALQNQSPPAWAVNLVSPHNPLGLANVKVSVTGVSPQGVYTPSGDATANRTLQWYDFQSNLLHTENLQQRMGQNSVLTNAITANTLQCVYCHIHIYGDTGEYLSGASGSYYFDRIHGAKRNAQTWALVDTTTTVSGSSPNLPVLDQSFTPDEDDLFNPLSGLVVYLRSLAQNYSGPQLPYNFQRQALMLPKFDPNSMLTLATGTLSGGTITGVPFGTSAATPLASVNGVYSGNVLLDGRTNANLVISGNVFFQGDVVIFGQIAGSGAIYSGRNIYIADDLTYVNPPTVFNGSQASNTLMDSISQGTTTAAAVAQGMTGDQLSLVATNSIVVGDPYAENVPLSGSQLLSSLEMSYGDRAEGFRYSGQIAQDNLTGYQLDYSNGSFLYPWSTPNAFLPPSQVRTSQVRQYSVSQINDPTITDMDWNLDWLSPAMQPYLMDLFYPANMVNGTLTPWISQANFLSAIQNPAKMLQAKATDGSNRRGLTLGARTPIFWQSPYDATHWATGNSPAGGGFTEGAMLTLQRLTGIVSQLETPPSPVDNNGNYLTPWIQTYFNNCQSFMATQTAGRTKSTQLAPNNYGLCFFYYQVSTNVVCTMIGNAVSYDQPPSSQPTLTQTCNLFSTGASIPSQDSYYLNSDLEIRVTYNYQAGVVGNYSSPQRLLSNTTWIHTRWWDPNLLRPKNWIQKVQAYLFANQFITFPGKNSLLDPPFRLDGGLVAKDIFGRLVSSPNSVPATATPTYSQYQLNATINSGMFPTYNLTNAFAMLPTIVMHDPRAETALDFLYQNFDSVVSQR